MKPLPTHPPKAPARKPPADPSPDESSAPRRTDEEPAPQSTPHAQYLEHGRADALEHGELPESGHGELPGPAETDLVATVGSHTAAPDSRAEEPFGELTAGAETEGGEG